MCAALLGERICGRHDGIVHGALTTDEGDGTVVAASAVGGPGAPWYFPMQRFVHQDLLSAPDIQNAILDVLENKPIAGSLSDAPPPAPKRPLLRIGGMSPVDLLATDGAGEETGIVPIPGAPGISFAKRSIPGSAADVSGEENFLYLPPGADYAVRVTGYDFGPANIRLERLGADGTVEETTTLSDIPVIPGSSGTFSITEGGSLSAFTFDANGDGSPDAVVVPRSGTTTEYAQPAPLPERPPPPNGSISIPTQPPPPAPQLPSATSAPPDFPPATTSPEAPSAAKIRPAAPPRPAPQHQRAQELQRPAAQPPASDFSRSAAAYPAARSWLQRAWSMLVSALARLR